MYFYIQITRTYSLNLLEVVTYAHLSQRRCNLLTILLPEQYNVYYSAH
jgi:hypothetical protein